MTRLAARRETHLTADEIARETLRQFDAGAAEPSIRTLAAALRVAPTAIYHHFPSRAAIYQAAVEIAWAEAGRTTFELLPEPYTADPADVLVVAGIATRRTWLAHYRLARYMAATPEANEFTNNALGLMAILFERMGLDEEEAAAAFHTYAGFMIGAVLFAADRLAANEQLTRSRPAERLDPPYPVETTQQSGTPLDRMMALSVVDPERDEELFALGLRRLIRSFTV